MRSANFSNKVRPFTALRSGRSPNHSALLKNSQSCYLPFQGKISTSMYFTPEDFFTFVLIFLYDFITSFYLGCSWYIQAAKCKWRALRQTCLLLLSVLGGMPASRQGMHARLYIRTFAPPVVLVCLWCLESNKTGCSFRFNLQEALYRVY